MIAALFVQKNGTYFGLPNVDPWDESRDAMKYEGPFPVIAHPPCARWCQLAGLVEARWGYKQGEDGGCFASALASVRKWGGVLEHPAFTKAFPAYGLPAPKRGAGWQRTPCGGWVCHVEQGRYGHPARKATWLYAFNTARPELDWKSVNANESQALVSRCGNKTKVGDKRRRLTSKEASATPEAFKAVLITLAESVPFAGAE